MYGTSSIVIVKEDDICQMAGILESKSRKCGIIHFMLHFAKHDLLAEELVLMA